MRKKKKKKYKRKKKVEGGIKGGKNKSKAKQILAELARKEHGSPVQCVGLVMFVRWQEGKVNVRWAWSKEWARVCRYLCVVLARAPRTQRVVVLECKGAGWRGGKKKKKKSIKLYIWLFWVSKMAGYQVIPKQVQIWRECSVSDFLLADCDISGVSPRLTCFLRGSGRSFCTSCIFRLQK